MSTKNIMYTVNRCLICGRKPRIIDGRLYDDDDFDFTVKCACGQQVTGDLIRYAARELWNQLNPSPKPMLNPEQAQSLIADGATSVSTTVGAYTLDNFSLLEYILFVESILGAARRNGKLNNIAVQTPERLAHFQEAAGIMLLALQRHGVPAYTTKQLKLALHNQQPEKKAALLENEFMASETKDAYLSCYDAARNTLPFDESDWRKLRMSLQKLGVQV